MRNVTLAAIQTEYLGSTNENIENIVQKIYAASKKGAEIVVYPELGVDGYFPQYKKEKNSNIMRLAETIPGATTDIFCDLAKDLGLVIVAPKYEIDEGTGNYYNSAAVIDKGRLLGTYRKMHLPNDPGFWERDYFSEGNLGFPVFETTYGNISVLICFDTWFPEAARICALPDAKGKHAEIIANPYSFGSVKGESVPEGDWKKTWKESLHTRASENGVVVVTANPVGELGSLNLYGGSGIYTPFEYKNKIASGKRQQVVVEGVDLDVVEEIRDGWLFFQSRRPGSYGKLCDEGVPKPVPKKI